MTETPDNANDGWHYLAELRSCLLKYLFTLSVVFLILFPFAQELYQFLARPLIEQLPKGITLIATSITSPLFVPIKLIAIVSLFCTMPVFFFHVWQFVHAALYPQERKGLWLLSFVSMFLFYLGVLFTYLIVFPFLFRFLIHAAPDNVHVLPDISTYLDFCLQLFFAFGLIFEVPLVVNVLVWWRLVSVDNFVSKRPYIIVGSFIIGMIFSPPDVLSQILLAVPLWLLFEIGILVARWLVRYQR